MKSEAYIRVTCDKCQTEGEVELDYRYSDYSGRNGSYVCPFKENGEAHSEGVGTFYEMDEDTHICQECKESEDEDEDEDEDEEVL